MKNTLAALCSLSSVFHQPEERSGGGLSFVRRGYSHSPSVSAMTSPSRRAEAPGNITIVSMPSIREETAILERAVEEKIWRYDTHTPDHHPIC